MNEEHNELKKLDSPLDLSDLSIEELLNMLKYYGDLASAVQGPAMSLAKLGPSRPGQAGPI